MLTPLDFALLFDEFRAESWARWREILAGLGPDVRELFVAAGRGSGKSRTVALLACALATRRYRTAPGERIFASIVAPDRRQASLTHGYAVGLIRSRPELGALVVAERSDSVDLANGVTLEVVTASAAAPRGRSYCFVGLEEAAFFPTGDSANPDREILRAVRPGLARVPGSLLAVVSSPWARRGILYEASQRAEKSPSPRLVYVNAPTLALNPTFDAAAIDDAREDDPIGAATEYGAEFRSDVESYCAREAVEACIVPDRHEFPPTPGLRYSAFVDPSGGSRDSFTLAIGHAAKSDAGSVAVIDAARERKAPFSPEEVVAEFAALLKLYRVSTVVGDRYAGEWPREAFRRHGIAYEIADRPKSDLYRDALGLLNSGRVELPDSDRLLGQIVGLERRTARGGRDSIDHAPGGTDDLANAVLGLAVTLAVKPHPVFATQESASLIGV